MPNLVLEMRQGDMMVVNGAGIRFRSKTRIELTAPARFLFGKQLMMAEEATTPVRRVYFAMQQAYIGNEEERIAGLQQARARIAAYVPPLGDTASADDLAQALSLLESGSCYQALKLCREVIRVIDGVPLGSRPSPTAVAAE